MAAGLVLSLVGCGTSAQPNQTNQANQTYTLKFGHVLAESEPFHAGFLAWADAVKQRTNGAVTIEVYPAGQLGVEEDVIEQIKSGAPQGWNTDSARLGMYVPEIAVMNGPYFVANLDEVAKLRDSQTLKGYLTKLEEQGLKVVSFNWVQGCRNFYTNKPINTPADLNGLRIRTPGSPIWQESVRALGAEPVAMNFGDMYSGIQQGAVDGAELVYANIPGGKLYEVLSQASDTCHIILINFEIVSATWFNSLPAEYQTAITEEADNAGRAASQTMQDGVSAIKDQLKSDGMTINETPDVAAFKTAGEAAYAKLSLTEVKRAIWQEIGKQ